jgi:hypothetical protein
MFKLIGIIVVLIIFFVGYPYIQEWYEGKVSPKEAVTGIREELGSVIKPDKIKDGYQQKEGSVRTNDGLNQSNSTESNSNQSPQTQPSAYSTEDAARNLLKQNSN